MNTTARQIRTAAENLAQSYTEHQKHKHHLYNPDATEEERATAEHWQAACINDGAAWMNVWNASGYINTMRNGTYRAHRIFNTAAARYAQMTTEEPIR